MPKKLLRSFRYAGQGFPLAFRGRNMKIHGVATLVALLAGWWFDISRVEWLVVLLVIGLVWALEMVNSAVEHLANTVRDELQLSYQATQAPRDLMAAAVLVMAVVSVICAWLIFVPYLSQ